MKLTGIALAATIATVANAMPSSRGARPSPTHSPSDAVVSSPPTDSGDIVIGRDLGIRFQKFGGVSATEMTTVTRYPISYADALRVRLETDAVSVIHHRDCDNCYGTKRHDRFLEQHSISMPTHPSSDPMDPYWSEMREVVTLQMARRNNEDVSKYMPLPITWQDADIATVAEYVHDEFPGVYHSDLITQELIGKAPFNRDAVPSVQVNTKDFVRGPVMLSAMNGRSILTVAPVNFQTKWKAGRARPEEVAWLIATDVLTEADGVPADIVSDVKSMGLTQATDFTAYAEGSPRHPSWPAMHSAASSGSLWLAVVMDLTEEQLCQVRLLDYAIAYARTVAGVHFPDDNIAGLKMGYALNAEYLPRYLHDEYGAKKNKVEDRIDSIMASFSWDTFLDSDCYQTHMNL